MWGKGGSGRFLRRFLTSPRHESSRDPGGLRGRVQRGDRRRRPRHGRRRQPNRRQPGGTGGSPSGRSRGRPRTSRGTLTASARVQSGVSPTVRVQSGARRRAGWMDEPRRQRGVAGRGSPPPPHRAAARALHAEQRLHGVTMGPSHRVHVHRPRGSLRGRGRLHGERRLRRGLQHRGGVGREHADGSRGQHTGAAR